MPKYLVLLRVTAKNAQAAVSLIRPCSAPLKSNSVPPTHAAGGRRATPTNRTTAPPLITPPTHPKRINP